VVSFRIGKRGKGRLMCVRKVERMLRFLGIVDVDGTKVGSGSWIGVRVGWRGECVVLSMSSKSTEDVGIEVFLLRGEEELVNERLLRMTEPLRD
jgi:hypothetical protein